MINKVLTKELVNPQTNVLAFRLIELKDDQYFKSLKSFNCYKMILIKKGQGRVRFDTADFPFSDNCLLRFPIYQPFSIDAKGPLEGVLLQFHPDFFWNHKYDVELTSKQVLFKSIEEVPLIKLEKSELEQLMLPIDSLLYELSTERLGQYDIAISWVKIFMIYASRIKDKRGAVQPEKFSEYNFISRELINAIEEHFHHKHRPGDYAKLLNITVKTLNRVAKQQLEKTVGDMISDRIITQAKHELYLSVKPVKQIADELGFNDVSYFSRFFKHHVAVSPELYRRSIRRKSSD
ncbi:helix-turn-helix domain-containing protein [Arachidicoccus terrestris]|uniref:helix-turn-helix domain-containing protein n=1 Tax=Arachidicoccus terrestris TaxID=2875539 RepID=UPI001CC5DB97|nr:AraC family transcriptional regulator [Arachidicoccus terrestris]UAY56002.1 AraC family transcriptional regulator [Arachidicoccus terrestris]